MQLTKAIREDFVGAVMAAVPKTPEPDYPALPELAPVLNSVIKRPLVPAGSLDLVAQLRAAGLKLKE